MLCIYIYIYDDTTFDYKNDDWQRWREYCTGRMPGLNAWLMSKRNTSHIIIRLSWRKIAVFDIVYVDIL
jgi:hypothetical protein